MVGTDVVSCTHSAASFASAAVGTGKTVTVTGLALSGADGRQLRSRVDDGDDDGGHHGEDADPEPWSRPASPTTA